MNDPHWVPALQMTYDYDPVRAYVTFSDGVKYTVEEAITIAKGKPDPETIRVIHAVKKIFDGVVEKQQFDWKEPEPADQLQGKEPLKPTPD